MVVLSIHCLFFLLLLLPYLYLFSSSVVVIIYIIKYIIILCAYSHCAGMKEFPTIVTASMDQMDLHGELNAFQDLQLVGAVTYAGNSSMNVDIDVATIEPSPKIVLSASLFV